jgi:hypothetical protein
MKYSEELRIRLRHVIINTCNTTGCKNCDLKWDDGQQECCSATDLQNRIDEAERQEEQENK